MQKVRMPTILTSYHGDLAPYTRSSRNVRFHRWKLRFEQSALTISGGSGSTLPYAFSDNHRFPNMLLSSLAFAAKLVG